MLISSPADRVHFLTGWKENIADAPLRTFASPTTRSFRCNEKHVVHLARLQKSNERKFYRVSAGKKLIRPWRPSQRVVVRALFLSKLGAACAMPLKMDQISPFSAARNYFPFDERRQL